MIPIYSNAEVFMMDEVDYDELLLLNALEDDDHKHHHHHNHHKYITSAAILSTPISETSSSGFGEDDMDDAEFFDDDTVEIVNIVRDDEPSFESNNPSAVPITPENKKRVQLEEEPESEESNEPARVGVPSKFDILCGQSRICAGHTGNRRFQVVLDIYAPRYDASTSKQEKMTLTKEIVGCIHAAGGRFLKYKEGLWEEISNVTARDKVSHALRTKVVSWKRQQQEEEKNSKPKRERTEKPSHRRAAAGRSRRSSGSSIATSASDIVTTSFDGNDSESACVMGELLKAQREIFATMTTSNSEQDSPHPLKA